MLVFLFKQKNFIFDGFGWWICTLMYCFDRLVISIELFENWSRWEKLKILPSWLSATRYYFFKITSVHKSNMHMYHIKGLKFESASFWMRRKRFKCFGQKRIFRCSPIFQSKSTWWCRYLIFFITRYILGYFGSYLMASNLILALILEICVCLCT